MRPLLLATMVAIPFLHGCAKTCTTEGLQASLAALPDPSPDATAKALAAACPDDPALGAWLAQDTTPPAAAWSAACAGNVSPASLDEAPVFHHRKRAFAECKVSDVLPVDETTFTLATGRVAEALVATQALQANDKIDNKLAAGIGMQLLGPPTIELPPVSLPRVEGAPIVPTAPPRFVVTSDTVTEGGNLVDLQTIAPEAGATLAVAGDVSAHRLLRVIEATTPADHSAAVWVMATSDGQDDRPTLVSPSVAAEQATASLAPEPEQSAEAYLIALDALDRSSDGPVNIDTSLGLCDEPPAGMVCVPGGPVDDTVTESTFYADRTEASVADYRACVEARACPDVPTRAGADQPMTGLSFLDARMYCSYAGKRLPTRWEYQRLATPAEPGEPATCELANHGGCAGRTRAVTDGEANRWGALNVLGNAAEATSTYPAKRSEKCGKRCEGIDPLGPCDGAPMCKGRLSRIFAGGSAVEPAGYAVPEGHKIVNKKRRLSGQGVRCVSDSPVLDSLPVAWVQTPPPTPDRPAALDDAARAVMTAIPEDNINEIPECDDGRRGSSRTDCKDPTHYIYPNEDRAPITYPYIRNRGGALLGVGSDQNYTFAAIARSELVFLIDYDAIVVHIHRVNQAFIKAADTPDEFVAMWDPKNRASSLEIIAKEWEGDPMMPTYQRTLRSLNRIMFGHYQRTRKPSPSGATSWLRDAEAYGWVRDLWRGGRVVSLKGDMLGPNAMMGVGNALRELEVPMRVYYTSNAPNAWGGMMTPEYKRNVRNFPMDERSVVLQALGWVNEFGQTGHWHFNVQDGPQVQQRLGMDGYTLLWQVVRPYRNTDDVDLSLSGLKGTWADAHPE